MSPKYALSQFSAIKGDGEADDTLPFLDACAKMPNGAVCEWDVKMRWTDTVVLSNRSRIRFWNAHDPRDVTPQEMEFGAFYDGPAGHDMFVRERCRRVSLEGILLAGVPHNETTGGAGRILYDDQHAGTGGETSTRSTLTRVALWMGFRNDGEAFANALASVGNCDYPTFKDVMIVGGGGKAGMVRWYGRWNGQVDGISVDAGSDVAIAARAGTFRVGDDATQERFVIGSPAGRFETRIIGVISDTQAKLATVSPIAFDHAYATVGESFGTGIRNGQNFNDKHLRLDDIEVYGCRYGIHSAGGSMGLMRLTAFKNEVNVFIEGSQGEASWEIGTDTEDSRQHLLNLSGKPYAISGARFAPIGILPGGAYLDFGAMGGGSVLIEYSSIDNSALPPGSTCFGLQRSSRQVTSQHNAYPKCWSRSDLGWLSSQLGKGTLIHTSADDMQGGPAQTAAEEWIGNAVPNARMRLSGGIGWRHGMAMDPVRPEELAPGEVAIEKIKRTGNAKFLQLIARDWDNDPCRFTIPIDRSSP